MNKKQSKQKGPKGRKARAKAKLERQWGEERMGSQARRVGKSRLLHRKNFEADKLCENVKPEETKSDGSLDEEPEEKQDDESDDEEQACMKLLQSLRREAQDDDGSSTLSADESETNSEVVNKDQDMNAIEENNTPLSLLKVDPFSERFSSPPLSTKETERMEQLSMFQSPSLTLRFHNNVFLQASKPLIDKLGLNNGTDMNSQCSARSKALMQSFMRKTLLSQSSDSKLERSVLFPFASLYADMLVTTSKHKSDDLLYALHVLNHVLTTRTRIQRHNRRLQTEATKESDSDAQMIWHRDQGYARPTVLVLLPTRGCCYAFVKQLQKILQDSNDNERFELEFGPPSMEGIDLSDPVEQHRRKAVAKKGKEWLELFGDEVNDDDDFKLGLALHENKQKKQNDDENSWSLKLFSDFYKSDIILTSPLGLKMNSKDKEDDSSGFGFLSSIEICLVLRGDVLLMQNWDHVNDLLPELNQQPQETSGIDFSRVRNYFLDGQAAHWRQLIISSSFQDPFIESTFKRHAKSIAGIVRVRRQIDSDASSITDVLLPTQQVFQRVPTSSFVKQSEDRLKYFFDKVLTPMLRKKQTRVLIFIPSYFDFVSVRNMLLKEEASFVMVTEYSRHTETSRARARFLQGRRPILLYTGRAHFFYRHAIRGARHVVFLGLPEHAMFYPQLVNLLNDGAGQDDEADTTCLALFTKYEKFALERIVGSDNCGKMLSGDKSTFLFS